MPYYKKIKKLLITCLFSFVAIGVTAVHAGVGNSALNIKNAELVLQDDEYVLNADVDVKLSSEIEQAVNKGFELNFLVEFQLVVPRKYWFDDEIVTVTHHISLSYHALSRQYLLIRDDSQKLFASLDEAKQALSEIRDLKVLQKSDVEKVEPYKAKLLMRLDYKKLPKALQVDVIGSDDWKISSQRFEWIPNLAKLETAK
ncbi:hypothetical protein GALL_154740 [mine drainage metagenome]|uniref:DUF4390 domain-containing protein n=1 Tax=mine drainage metagenome TaxID=410659 RepID=A0A1J5S3C7_9ZZZZ